MSPKSGKQAENDCSTTERLYRFDMFHLANTSLIRSQKRLGFAAQVCHRDRAFPAQAELKELMTGQSNRLESKFRLEYRCDTACNALCARKAPQYKYQTAR